MRKRVKEMEEESQKLIELQSQVEKDLGASGGISAVNKEETDARSVYVGNVCISFTLSFSFKCVSFWGGALIKDRGLSKIYD